MTWLVGWHTRIGRTGLRLLGLHLLWLGWTLRGGVVLGAFPATAAVYAIARKDFLAPEDEQRPPLRSTFSRVWRSEFAAANRLGYLVLAIWAVLMVNRRLVAVVDFGAVSPLLAGVLSVAGVVLFATTVTTWIAAAHFDDGGWALLRRGLILVMARPLQAAPTWVAAAVIAAAYYLVPGLVPVFGVVLPAYVSSMCLWSTGVLAHPRAASVASSGGLDRAPRARTASL